MKILYCEQSIAPMLSLPTVSLLTDSSVSRNNRPLFLPPHHDDWVITIAPAFRVSRLGKFVAAKFARRYYDAFTLTARLRPARVQYPASAVDTAFDSSIVIGEMMSLPADVDTLTLDITGNVSTVSTINLKEIDMLTSQLSSYFMIKHGDIIIPGDIATLTLVKIDTMINLNTNSTNCLNFKIK